MSEPVDCEHIQAWHSPDGLLRWCGSCGAAKYGGIWHRPHANFRPAPVDAAGWLRKQRDLELAMYREAFRTMNLDSARRHDYCQGVLTMLARMVERANSPVAERPSREALMALYETVERNHRRHRDGNCNTCQALARCDREASEPGGRDEA